VLPEFWDLTDLRGNVARIRFNQYVDRPLIVGGWKKLRKFYSLKGHHGVFFNYLGGNKFKIKIFMEPLEPFMFPSYHRKSKRLAPRRFSVTLTKDTANNSQLVKFYPYMLFLSFYRQFIELYDRCK
jgi:hypothetical protein